jgi:GGDEF domain-containing protein
MLVAVAERLTGVLRPGDMLARLSGDDFVIHCQDLDGPSQADAIVARADAAPVDCGWRVSGRQPRRASRQRARCGSSELGGGGGEDAAGDGFPSGGQAAERDAASA